MKTTSRNARNPLFSAQALAAVLAVGCTSALLAGVDTLAQQRSVSSHARVVQLQRVVVTAPRNVAVPTAAPRIATVCDESARRC